MKGESEVKEVEEVKEKCGKVAAFFDLDGTLLAGPSLERRFFVWLRKRREIGAKNYLWWLAGAVRLAPQGIAAMRHANKMYLRGVRVAEGQAGMILPGFFPGALQRVMWHAKNGHAIVVVSGTLEPLAREAAMGLEAELEARGVVAEVRICATQLAERDARWTGRVLGEAMYRTAKARAVKKIAAALRFDLAQSFAYGDTATDRWMLASVGRSAAVNPSQDLLRIAQRERWPVLWWDGNKPRKHQGADSPQRSQRPQRRADESAALTTGTKL